MQRNAYLGPTQPVASAGLLNFEEQGKSLLGFEEDCSGYWSSLVEYLLPGAVESGAFSCGAVADNNLWNTFVIGCESTRLEQCTVQRHDGNPKHAHLPRGKRLVEDESRTKRGRGRYCKAIVQ
eukprot:1157253-Pelagomonas_calceolata.AAC.7